MNMMNKCAKFHEDSPIQSPERNWTFGDGQFCVQLCIETLCKRATSVAYLTNFSFEFFYEIFTEDVSEGLLYHGAKKSKMTKNSNQAGPALRSAGGDPGLDHLQIFFLTVCVSLSGLGPSETHEKLSMRKMCDSSNEKQGEKLFLLWRHSALLVRPCSWLAKNRRQGKPDRRRHARDWSVRCTVALPLQAPLTCTSSLSCVSSDRWESHWKRNLRQR